MMAIAYDSAGATLSSRRTGARHDVRATRLWRKFGRADVTRLLYAESLIVSYKQPRFEAGGHTVANRGARPNELFPEDDGSRRAVEVESELALPVSGLSGTNVGRKSTHGQETSFSR